MPGDDRIRYCPECQLSVYNFSAMTRAEVETLVVARLSEPTSTVVVGEIASIDTRNPIRKFFSRLRRIF